MAPPPPPPDPPKPSGAPAVDSLTNALTLPGDAAPPTAVRSYVGTDRGADPSGPAEATHESEVQRAPTEVQQPSLPSNVDTTAAPLDDRGFAGRYELRKVLGVGGMGEVRLCRDRRIGREVAVKAIRPQLATQADARARFVREARVQGQLEHPSVVPVYDLGVGPDGGTFFTMKRVRGMTLEQIVAALVRDAPGARERYSRRRLLTAFGNVCLAIDFAHSRGVLHRDLKPANVMLGDFGEVHVLDWGLARVVGAPDAEPADGAAHVDAGTSGDEPHAGAAPVATRYGQLMGTPGYMAPEQARGQLDRLDARTDVYALGAVLFELLTLQALHDAPTVPQRLISTLSGIEARASVRAPEADVAPELEQIVLRATALEPEDRFASARALSDAVERYLDGDRDLQRRRELAAVHAEAARESLSRAASADSAAAARDARKHAMRDATRALALDPDHAGAIGTLAQLLMDVPADMPPEAEAELARTAAHGRTNAARISAVRSVIWVLFMPIVAWMGARNWTVALVTAGALLASAGMALWLWRRGRTEVFHGFGLLVLSSTAIGCLSALFGPFVVVPCLAATNTMFYALNATRSERRIVTAVGVLTVIVPVALDLLGVVPPAYGFRGDQIVIYPRMASFPAAQTLLFLLVANVSLVVTPTLLAGRLRDALAAAERRLVLHSWHLRQLVPDQARPSVDAMRDGPGG